MKLTSILALLVLCAAVLGGCERDRMSERGFSLPGGDAAAGRDTFVYMQCHQCHFIEGEGILYQLSAQGICASSGSACTSGSLEPSHVLRAMGVPFTAAHGSIRYSLSIYNTEEEIDFIIDKMPPIIERLRQMSPFWREGQLT